MCYDKQHCDVSSVNEDKMSNIIPMVSSSPPPMDSGDGFDWDDDDDDGFGTFIGPNEGASLPQGKQSAEQPAVDNMNVSASFPNKDAVPAVEQSDDNDNWSDFGNFANFANDSQWNTDSAKGVSTTEDDSRPGFINLPKEANDCDGGNSEISRSEKCLNCDTNGILTDSGMYSSDISPVPQHEEVMDGKSNEDVDSVEDISIDSPDQEQTDVCTPDSMKVVMDKELPQCNESKISFADTPDPMPLKVDSSDCYQEKCSETDRSNEDDESCNKLTGTDSDENQAVTVCKDSLSVCQSSLEDHASQLTCDIDSHTNIPVQETSSHSSCNPIENASPNVDDLNQGDGIQKVIVEEDRDVVTVGNTEQSDTSFNEHSSQENSECNTDWNAFSEPDQPAIDSVEKVNPTHDHITSDITNNSDTEFEKHLSGKDDIGHCDMKVSDNTITDQVTTEFGANLIDSKKTEESIRSDGLVVSHNAESSLEDECAISVDNKVEFRNDSGEPRNNVEGNNCDLHLKESAHDHQCIKDNSEQIDKDPEESDGVCGDVLEEGENDDFGNFSSNNLDEEDDFADFSDFKTAGLENHRNVDTGGGTFAAFSSTETQDQAQADDWAGFSEAEPSARSTETQEGNWAAFSEKQMAPVLQGEDEDGDEWADFDDSAEFSAGETSQPNVEPTSEKLSLAVPQNMSKQEKILYAVTTCFPAVVSDLDAEVSDIDSLVSVSEATHTEASVWLQIRGLQTTNALSYQWSRSQWNNQLFSTLSVDTRNVLVGHKKAQVPIFASGLTLLEPTKGQGAPLKPDVLVDTSKGDTQSTTQTQEAIPPAQFDWQGSGLTNPLEANKTLNLDFLIQDQATKSNALESEFLNTIESSTHKPAIQPLENILANLKGTPTFKPTNQHEDVSASALKIVGNLPDLSFMRSKVLMFPIKMDQ